MTTLSAVMFTKGSTLLATLIAETESTHPFDVDELSNILSKIPTKDLDKGTAKTALFIAKLNQPDYSSFWTATAKSMPEDATKVEIATKVVSLTKSLLKVSGILHPTLIASLLSAQ